MDVEPVAYGVGVETVRNLSDDIITNSQRAVGVQLQQKQISHFLLFMDISCDQTSSVTGGKNKDWQMARITHAISSFPNRIKVSVGFHQNDVVLANLWSERIMKKVLKRTEIYGVWICVVNGLEISRTFKGVVSGIKDEAVCNISIHGTLKENSIIVFIKRLWMIGASP